MHFIDVPCFYVNRVGKTNFGVNFLYSHRNVVLNYLQINFWKVK